VPNYEYECTQCARRFEVWQSVGEAAPPCAECKGEVKKVFHVPRVIFKGSGFYVTDLRAEKGGNGASGGKSESIGSSDESSNTTSEVAKTADATSSESKTSEVKSTGSDSPNAGSSSAPAK
jgi:putative FmdB family regulatory protein